MSILSASMSKIYLLNVCMSNLPSYMSNSSVRIFKIDLFVCLIYLFVCLIYLFVCLIYLFVCLIYLFVCLLYLFIF